VAYVCGIRCVLACCDLFLKSKYHFMNGTMCFFYCRDDAHVIDSGGVVTNLSDALQVSMGELDGWGANLRSWIAAHVKDDLVRFPQMNPYSLRTTSSASLLSSG
jgi:hypothetical protein